jgi:HD-GYP domain-containing protein (c-di-GMP phosphodiesterase class II)
MSQNQFLDIDTEKLLHVGNLLSNEKKTAKLLEIILKFASELSYADGGSIYTIEDQQVLHFEIMQNNTLQVHAGGNSGKKVPIDDIPLFNPDGTPILNRVVNACYHNNQTYNIENAYEQTLFDLSGMKDTDKKLGYKSISFLTVPMRNHESEIIGVLQLINARSPDLQEIIPFSEKVQYIVESLAAQAAIALTNRLLIDRRDHLFESFVTLINQAIDNKSAYTGAHYNRIPDLTTMLADAVCNSNIAQFKEFSMSDKDRYELKIASLLHVFGKVTTPVHAVHKVTKLHTIFDRIDLIDTRFEVVKRDLEIQCLQSLLSADDYQVALKQIDQDYQFIQKINSGEEMMSEDDLLRLHKIDKLYAWRNSVGEQDHFFTVDEIYNLRVRSGKINHEESQVINRHSEAFIDMLSAINWPSHLKNVPSYAVGHYEETDGTGYPLPSKRNEMTIQARCMVIADIFEALTAKDRPYKKGKKLSESLHILGKMKLNNHIDPDLFNLFIWDKVYEKYAFMYLNPAQMDDFDITQIPGYEKPIKSVYSATVN